MDAPVYMYYCRPDTLFHDVPGFERGTFARSTDAAPTGWRRGADREWVTLLPDAPLPRQGWKIHVSATPDSAEDVLATCWDYCVANEIAFKFLKSTECLLARSSKYADRAGSGKFVTIYPVDDAQLATVLDELGALLDGQPGPYILSDIRWRNGPLYVRYGAFEPVQLRTSAGDLRYAIEDPEGRLVPDVRGPGFRPPPWVPLPAPVQEAVDARQGTRLSDFPYRPRKALHFSNGGGVYHGTDRDEAPVLLKEARPFAGLDTSGADAVARLDQERWAYEQLAGLPQIPRLYDYRRGHEHYFLVREEVDGEDLQHLIFARNPLLRADASPEDFAAYAEWALAMIDRVEEGLSAIHSRGVVYADLHPGNVMVTADGSLRFIDLEASRPIEERTGQFMAAPGYSAPPGCTGAAMDRYALGVMRLAMFVPMPSLLIWGPDKAGEFLATIRRWFPVPADFEDRVRADLTPTTEPLPAEEIDERQVAAAALIRQIGGTGWPETGGAQVPESTWRGLAARIATGILDSADLDRSDRLYPGDVQQFLARGAGLGLAHGAAGVQWTLHSLGYDVPESHRAWLRDAVRRHPWGDPGLVDGAAGTALALHALGERELAADLLDRAVDVVSERSGWRLADGRSGVGLALLEVAAHEDDPSRAARLVDRAGEIVRGWRAEDVVPVEAGSWGPGLFGGATGPAALAVAWAAVSGEEEYLDHAAAALRHDVAEQRRISAGAGNGTLSPLLVRGSGGTAVVADRLLAQRHDADLAAFRDEVRTASAVPFVNDGGLFGGRAGLMALRRILGAPRDEAHLRSLSLHVVGWNDALVTLGPLALRLSADLGTGAAGVLLAVHGELDEGPVAPPFLGLSTPARLVEGAAR